MFDGGPRTRTRDDPLRVLVVTNMWPTSERPGYGVFVATQMRSVAAAGVSTRIHFVHGKSTRWAYLRSAARMLGLNFGRRRFDLIHAHTGHCGALAALQWRYPVLTSYVGYDLYGKPTAAGGVTPKSRVEAMLFRQLARRSERTITKSAQLAGLLPPSVRRRNAVIPNGVDRRRFAPLDRAAARRELGWSDEELVVLFAADPAVARKRFWLAEEVCERTAVRLPRVRLRVCANVDPADVPVWMNAADVLLVTSVAEGSPNVVKEAMACNLPVVSVDVGDVASITAGTHRCRVTADDADALVEALADVLAGAPERSDGRERTEHLALDAVAERLVQLYREVASASASTVDAIVGTPRARATASR